MPSKPFRAALVGAGGFGANTLAALRQCPQVELTGLADLDASVAARAAAEADCPAYTDDRRLLVETHPDAVFLAVPPQPAAELVRLAAHRRLHVWREVPAARNLPEAAGLCRALESAKLTYAIGTQRRFMLGYRRARELLGRLGQVYLLEAHYRFNWGPIRSWGGDRSAGGGVLTSLGYHVFNLIIWLLGLPETIYSVAGSRQLRGAEAIRGRPQDSSQPAVEPEVPAGAHAADQPLYDAEDTAVAVLRYPGKTAATVTVSRCFGPLSEALAVYGEAGWLVAGPGRCVLRDRDGTVLESFEQEEPPAAVFARQVEAFILAASTGAARYECSGRENLLTVAAIDAAGLSDRTGQPESPPGVLARNGLTVSECLAFAPQEQPS